MYLFDQYLTFSIFLMEIFVQLKMIVTCVVACWSNFKLIFSSFFYIEISICMIKILLRWFIGRVLKQKDEIILK